MKGREKNLIMSGNAHVAVVSQGMISLPAEMGGTIGNTQTAEKTIGTVTGIIHVSNMTDLLIDAMDSGTHSQCFPRSSKASYLRGSRNNNSNKR